MQLGCWSGSCEMGECVTSGDGLLKTSPTGDYSSVTSLLYSSQQVCFIQCFRYSLHKPATGVARFNEGMNKSCLQYITVTIFHPHVIQNLYVIFS